jgi:hypothetical protein
MCLHIQVTLGQFRLHLDIGQVIASPRPQQPGQAMLAREFDHMGVDHGAFGVAAGCEINQ